MRSNLPMVFPSEAAELRRHVEVARKLTPSERLWAAADALAAAERLSLAGDCRALQLEYHQRCEEEWRRRMSQFITEHTGRTAPDAG
jgi:hypothetical protein